MHSYGLKTFAALWASCAIAAFANSNDNSNYLGDKLDYPFNVTARYLDGGKEEVCIPKGTRLRGLNSGRQETIYVQVIEELDSCDSPSKRITSARVLEISRAAEPLKSFEPNRSGSTFGALVVPFKYFYSGSKDFTGSTTIGPYLGYRTSKSSYGWGLKYIAFLGATTVPVSQNINGQSTNQNLAGFSYGLGLIGEIKQDFQLGFVFGVDKVSDSSLYQNSGQPWIAFSLGFEFGR